MAAVSTSVGQINFGVGVNARDLKAELLGAVTPVVASAQRDISRNPIKIGADASDLKRAIAAVETMTTRLETAQDRQSNSASRLRQEEANLTKQRAASKDAATALKDAEDRLGALRGSDKTKDIERAERAVASARAAARSAAADLVKSEEQVNRARTNSAAASRDVIRAHEDVAKAQRNVVQTSNDVANTNARIRATFGQTKASSVDLTSGLLGVGKGLVGIGAGAGYASAAAAAVAALGGAAGAALGAVGGLAAGLASVGPAAAGIAATAVVGLQGMKDTFSALNDVTKNSASEARDHAEKVAAAQDQVASAQDQVTSALEQVQSAQDAVTDAVENAQQAQRTYNDAQKDAARAAEDVSGAYRDAERDLRHLQLTAASASLDQKEAVLNLKEAQAELAKAKPDQYERALLRVQRAQLDLTEAQQRNVEAQQDNNDAQAKGIDGSDKVVNAKERQAQADERVADAARGVDKANRDVVKAQEGVVKANEQVEKAQANVAKAQANLTKVQNEALPSQQKFNDLLAQLSPNAQAFVLAARDMMPLFTDLRKSTQDAGFAGLGDELRQTATAVLPVFKEGMTGVASQLNLAAKDMFGFIRSADGIDLIKSSFEGATELIAGLRQGTGEATQGLVDFAKTAAPQMEGVGRAITGVADDIGRVFSQSAASGQLTNIFQGFTEAIQGAGPLISDFIKTLLDMGEKILPTLKPLFDSLGQAILVIGPPLADLGADFIKALTPILPPLSDLIAALAEGLRPVLPVLSQLLQSLLEAATPLIEPFSRIAVVVGDTLVKTIQALQPALLPLANAFADLVTAIAPIIPLIANNVAVLIEALAPALSVVFKALAPVIQIFADQMAPVMKELAPILAQVALEIGQALADAITELAPYIPDLAKAFGEVVLAIAPLLPDLVRLALDVLPPLVEILKLIIPIIVQQADEFTYLMQNVIQPIVIPLMQDLQRIFETAWHAIGDAVNWVTDTVWPKIGTVLDSVKGWFSDAIHSIDLSWGRLGDIAAVPVNFVINTVWNNGLLKAWQSIDSLLGGILPDAAPIPEIPHRATGGPIRYIHGGTGNGTKDDILLWGSNNEHMITAKEVEAAGGHNVLFAIRDMIARGVPFAWDNGQIVNLLGRDNLNRYGAAVAEKGIGNVPPEGLFDQLIPKFQGGGAILPWMNQLKAGHDFARAQHGKPYQWAGPRFVGDSFDCSGFMGSIAAAILGLDPWKRYFATSSFGGSQLSSGPMGFVAGLDNGFAIGVTDDPGGPGGGHTAGTLGALPDLGIPSAVNVESGGSLGDVHYGGGTDPRSFMAQYHLPIGANGFFQPGAGAAAPGRVGPTPEEQGSLLGRVIKRMVDAAVEPIRKAITATIGVPPPASRAIPLATLNGIEGGFVSSATGYVGHLGGALSGAWQKAQDLGDKVLDFLNPFDSGGVASGTGFMPKNVIAPERVLSPEQTRLFDALVQALTQIAGASAAAAAGPQLLTSDIFQQGVAFLADAFNTQAATARDTQQTPSDDTTAKALDVAASAIDTAGRISANTDDLAQRSESSQALVVAQQTEQLKAVLDQILHMLSADVLIPVMQTAVDQGTQIVQQVIEGIGNQITKGTDRTTTAVENLDLGGGAGTGVDSSPPPFGAPGSAFDAGKAISDAIVSVADTAKSAFMKVAQDVANAALAQKPSKADPNRGVLGKDISGGPLVDMIVQLTGVEIQIRETLLDTYKEIKDFRGDLRGSFDDSGKILTDTAELVQRNESNQELVVSEQNRINRELIKAVIKYLLLNVILPIITAILGAMIQLATVAIGAAIGSFIPVIGPLIGAAIGAVIGAALAGLAAVFIGTLAVGAGAALDSFDSGGVAAGTGFMPKNTIAPERVLSPRQTQSFDRLVDVLDRADLGRRTTTINAPFTVVGGANAGRNAHNDLLSLLNS